MRRRELIMLLGGTAAAWSLGVRAQQPELPVIGVLNSGTRGPSFAAFRQGLNDGGYVEGRNVAIEFRNAGGQYDRLPAIADDLVRRQVTLIAATGGSVSALAGFTRAQDAYTAAKGALISLNKSLAIQFAKDNIRSNIIHPGIVDTPLQAPYLTEALRKEFETGIPLGRIAHPREIFHPAVVSSAYAVIVVHNHPSGDASPSQADHSLTRRLAEAAELLQIKLLAHIIIGAPTEGGPGYFSFKEAGVL